MKSVKIPGISIFLILSMVGFVFAGNNNAITGPQKICPVMMFGDMGCSVTKNDIYTDYEGKRIYFCSKDCRKKFKDTPEKYLKKMKNHGVVLEDIPAEN